MDWMIGFDLRDKIRNWDAPPHGLKPSLLAINMEARRGRGHQDMAKQMILKFDKYWSDIHGFMGVAVVLDPRMKLKIMKFSFPKLYHSKQRAEEEFTKLKKFFIEEEENETSGITSEDTTELDHYLKERVCNPNMKLDILAL
nr:hypothetical protein [Tanacetum cinerariifolium]